MLKKVGAVYLQQSVTVFPQNQQTARELQPILAKIDDSHGEYHLLPLRQVAPPEMDQLVVQFLEQTARHYGGIIENCEVNFTKEIEFETFQRNFTYEGAEEIRAEYDKILSWFERVRDWFGARFRSRSGSVAAWTCSRSSRAGCSPPRPADRTHPARHDLPSGRTGGYAVLN
jgi:hypothetical protein